MVLITIVGFGLIRGFQQSLLSLVAIHRAVSVFSILVSTSVVCGCIKN
ncbi:MAG: hypothetical protein ACI85E_002160 [Marinomonas primoryensis]